MARNYEYRSNGPGYALWAVLAAAVVGSLVVHVAQLGVPLRYASIGVCVALIVLLRTRKSRGMLLDGRMLVIAPRSKPVRIPLDDIIGAHIRLTPAGDTCSLHLTDKQRVHIGLEDCPKGLTLKSKLEARGVLVALR